MISQRLKTVIRRLPFVVSFARRLKGPYQHGHALLGTALDRGAVFTHGYLIEVGSTREKVNGQGSTVELAALAAQLGLEFVTVDMDPENTEQARHDVSRFTRASAVNARAEDFLANFREPVVAAYLDAFDIEHAQHSTRRIERYRKYLDTEITNDASELMHYECARLLLPNIVEGGLIVIDDTWVDHGSFRGKGARAVPFLLRNGFAIAAKSKTAIALRRTPPGAA